MNRLGGPTASTWPPPVESGGHVIHLWKNRGIDRPDQVEVASGLISFFSSSSKVSRTEIDGVADGVLEAVPGRGGGLASVLEALGDGVAQFLQPGPLVLGRGPGLVGLFLGLGAKLVDLPVDGGDQVLAGLYGGVLLLDGEVLELFPRLLDLFREGHLAIHLRAMTLRGGGEGHEQGGGDRAGGKRGLPVHHPLVPSWLR
ncbi:MAG: hypothetical protein ACMVY4_21480 [Minwuia sp.]|uniref:hypothetical protein n=1 Tax=Minwuia sp. TaxID=2493630 RepID=UPI003A864848